ncbi:DNA cytosine methyltransferase [Ruminiclostridium cellobioparum]|uniref:Cytosine-specific methyltransferase n=1 Tax=Ruminiclostridium cellobioparum subsp. termitidis CT1112 TaxID=1195236 RepID=S0FNB0_RUMCE|nr:DNA cytosine methyltransferase [Ruminiclostridium cellobioparum]EMS70634.1 DNA-methyltransferase (dcm) [Ruminiclostridium cellobioparum subsp. termitidis CT1112]
MQKLNTIDLFAGAGGLSYGFCETGCFDVKVAVECNKYAQETYKNNHLGVDIYDNICTINYKKLKDKYGSFDVVIGGPPCQGFSNANRQRNELVSGNNQLVNEYIKAVEELQPSAFVMENVKTINSDNHKFFFCEKIRNDVENLNIPLNEEIIPIAEVTFLPCVFANLLSGSDRLIKYSMAKENYIKINTIFRNAKSYDQLFNYLKKYSNQVSKFLNIWNSLHEEFWCEDYRKTFCEAKLMLIDFMTHKKNFKELKNALKIIIETQKAFYKIKEVRDNKIILSDIIIDKKNFCIKVKTYNIINYVMEKFRAIGYHVNKGIVNAVNFGVPQSRERFIIIGIKQGVSDKEIVMPEALLKTTKEFYTIGDAIQDIEEYKTSIDVNSDAIKKKGIVPESQLQNYLNSNTLVLHNHVNTNTKETALERFKNIAPGQNFHHLTDKLKETYSDPSRTQNTIYLRLDYNVPAGTVVNVRKSMWIHPSKDRAISIREAARLQSFPDKFIFYGPKDSQYQQVGNAVPPLLGRAIAEKVLELLGMQPNNKLKDVILNKFESITKEE